MRATLAEPNWLLGVARSGRIARSARAVRSLAKLRTRIWHIPLAEPSPSAARSQAGRALDSCPARGEFCGRPACDRSVDGDGSVNGICRVRVRSLARRRIA